MNTIVRKTVCPMVLVFAAGLVGGCAEPARIESGSTELAPQVDLGPTIGSLAQVVTPQPVAVEGYGLVGSLPGTGSAECPPQIRAYLKRYIVAQLPEGKVDADKLIDSDSTAVVWLQGVIPAAASQGQRFDVAVVALPGTQTTSLEGGWLYGAELWPGGKFGITGQPVATTEGAIFIDTLSSAQQNKRIGYILGGGSAAHAYRATVVIRKPDYRVAGAIRDKLNGRFGRDVAKAVSSGLIELKVPQRYKGQELRFTEIVRATYLQESPEIVGERVKTFVRKLAVSDDKHSSEIALEAIGKESLSKLAVLLNSSDQQVRLICARCMLSMGSDKGLETLRQIAMDADSAYRVEALEAVAASAGRDDAITIARTLLRDRNMTVVLSAYEQLRKLGDVTVTRESVGRIFDLEQVAQTEHKAVFVLRSGPPRIVLLGAPLSCRDDIFVQSQDGSVVIDSRAGQGYVSVTRKHPTRPIVLGPLRSTFELSDIIKTLCEEPTRVDEGHRRGLGVSYADAITLLKQMCDKDAITAEFWAGPLPEIGMAVKK